MVGKRFGVRPKSEADPAFFFLGGGGSPAQKVFIHPSELLKYCNQWDGNKETESPVAL